MLRPASLSFAVPRKDDIGPDLSVSYCFKIRYNQCMFLPGNITLEPGDSGDYVTELQRRLAARDLLAEGAVNGVYDGITTNAVKGFQSLHGLTIDGIAGPDTIRRLNTFGASTKSDEGGGAADDSATQDDEKAKWQTEQDRQFMIAQQLTAAYNQTNEAIIDPLNARGAATVDELRTQSKDGMNAGREQIALQQQEAIVNAAIQRDTVLTMRDVQNDLAATRGQDQLKFSRDGVEAKTPMDVLKEDPNKTPETGKELEGKDGKKTGQDITRDPKGQGLSPDQNPALTPEQLRAQAQNQGQTQTQTQAQGQSQGLSYLQPQAQNMRDIRINPNQPQGQDPRLAAQIQRTEGELDAPSKTISQSEGQHLHNRGVRVVGSVPPAQMGQLAPTQSPSIAPQRGGVGMG